MKADVERPPAIAKPERRPLSRVAARGRLDELKRSWVVLLACSFGASVGAAAFPLFLVPVIGLRLEAQFGWSRVDTSSLTSVAFVGGAAGVTLVGWLNDRWSVRKPAALSMAAVGLMLLLASVTPSEIGWWRLGIFWFMLLGAGTLSASFSKIICHYFDAMRGLALGVTIGSVSLASALALPVLVHLIDSVGTERFFFAAGIAYLLVFAPLLFWILPEIEPAPILPPTAPCTDFSMTGTVWQLGIAGTFLSIITGSTAHLAAIAADGGRVSPALVGSVFAAGVMVSRPVAGVVIDRIDARYVGAAAAAMAVTGLLLVGLFGDRFVLAAALLVASAVGAEFDIVAYLVSHYTSPDRFGRLFGWLYAGMLLAAAIGPLFVAFQLEAWGSYRPPFLSAAFLASVACAIMLGLPAYRKSRSEQ